MSSSFSFSAFETPVKSNQDAAFVTPTNTKKNTNTNTNTNANNGLFKLATLNNFSTPKSQQQLHEDEGQFNVNGNRNNMTSLHLEPLVESPFKPRTAPVSIPAPTPITSIPQQQNHTQPGGSTTTTTTAFQRSGFFTAEPGRYKLDNSAGPSTSTTTNTTSFQPMIDDNVILAMSRLQNKEFAMKRFLVSLFAAIINKLSQLFISFLYYNTSILDAAYMNFYNEGVITKVNYAIYTWIILNLVTSGLKLIQKQDQCLDLKLNNDQRALLGLELVAEPEKDYDDEQMTQDQAQPQPQPQTQTQTQTQTPVKQMTSEQNTQPIELDTIGKTNDLLSHLKISSVASTPSKR